MNSKELEVESRKKHIANLQRELENVDKALKELEDKLSLWNEREEILNAKKELMAKHYKIVNPTWEFETLPEYWDILKQEVDNVNKFSQIKKDAEMLTHNKQKESFLEQKKSLVAEIERIEKVMNNE